MEACNALAKVLGQVTAMQQNVQKGKQVTGGAQQVIIKRCAILTCLLTMSRE